jgi:D-amino-acid dehydrogenase
LRCAGTVEFGGLKAEPDYARADVVLRQAKELLPGLRDEGVERWMGYRPSMPDSLPVISVSPRFRNVFFGFGHGHLGLTQSASTGRLLADLVAGRAPVIDVAPYRADRF